MQQMHGLVVLVLAGLSLGASASRRSGLSEARAWLSSHGPQPQSDELQELRSANPEAYAIVKALLTKRALGLLDPKHPTASFAAPAAQAGAQPHESSVDFAASQGVSSKSEGLAQQAATVESADVEVEAPVVHHTHENWLNWRPADSAADDDAAVAQVLGTVAELKGGAAAGSLAATSQRVEVQAQPAQPEQPAQESNRYLKGIDFGVDARKESARPTAAENPYLKGIGLSSAKQVVTPSASQPAAPVQASEAKPQPHQNAYLKDIGLAAAKRAVKQDASEHNYLNDFSWGDDDAKSSKAPAAPAGRVLRQTSDVAAAPQQVPQAAPEAVPQVPHVAKKNALMAWLGSKWNAGVQRQQFSQPTAAPQPVQQPEGHKNAYLMDLQ